MKPWERAHMTAVGYGLILCLVALPILTATAVVEQIESTWPDSARTIYLTWPKKPVALTDLTGITITMSAGGGGGGGAIGANGGGGGAGLSMIYIEGSSGLGFYSAGAGGTGGVVVNPLTKRAQDEEAEHRRKLNEPRPCMIGRFMMIC